jgi:hypothetical protein
MPPALWTPSDEVVEHATLTRYQRWLEEARGLCFESIKLVDQRQTELQRAAHGRGIDRVRRVLWLVVAVCPARALEAADDDGRPSAGTGRVACAHAVAGVRPGAQVALLLGDPCGELGQPRVEAQREQRPVLDPPPRSPARARLEVQDHRVLWAPGALSRPHKGARSERRAGPRAGEEELDGKLPRRRLVDRDGSRRARARRELARRGVDEQRQRDEQPDRRYELGNGDPLRFGAQSVPRWRTGPAPWR